MTLKHYIAEVLVGRIVIEPPVARVVPDIPDEDKMEPTHALRCHAEHPDEWVCTRTQEHHGRHIAQNSQREICAIW